MDVAARLEAVEIENAMLRERVAALEAQLRGGFVAPVSLRLTPKENSVLGLLYGQPTVSKEGVMRALYADRLNDEPEIKIVDVFVCKIRKKLKPFGITILTDWGRGYSLPLAGRQAIRDMLALEGRV